jgi:hypothetical protein
MHEMETGVSAALPAERHREPSEQELRRELREAIEARGGADARAKLAAAAESRAAAALHDAQAEVTRLENVRELTTQAATQKAAKAAADALRAGSPVPAIVLPEAPDMASLATARTRRDALQLAHAGLAAERDAAKEEAASAAAEVRKIIDHIMDGEARAIAQEMVAARMLYLELEDRLAGLVKVDDKRHGGPRLHGLQQDLLRKIDRRKTAIAADPRMLEEHYWRGHLDAIEARQEQAWMDYSRRLADDADAAFDGGEHLA